MRWAARASGGSRARGESGAESDVDLLVEVERRDDGRDLELEVLRALGDVPFATDVVVATSELLDRRGDAIGTVLWRALREGVVIFGVDERDAHTCSGTRARISPWQRGRRQARASPLAGRASWRSRRPRRRSRPCSWPRKRIFRRRTTLRKLRDLVSAQALADAAEAVARARVVVEAAEGDLSDVNLT